MIPLQAVALERKEIPRIKFVVTDELKQITMKLIAATFRDDFHCRSRVMPLASWQGAGFNFEFLQRIGERHWQIQVVEGIVVCSAIHHVSDSVRLSACHRNGHSWKIFIGIQICRRSWSCQTGKEDQFRSDATIQGQFDDALVVNDLSHCIGERIDHGDA